MTIRRALITGGSGFIGGHLTKALVGLGVQVTILDDLSNSSKLQVSTGSELVIGSVLDADLVRSALRSTDICFHLAAIPSVEKSTTDYIASHRVNITGLVTVISGIRDAKPDLPLIYASSAAVYGASEVLPATESHPATPTSAYGADKLACEQHARAAHVSFGLRSIGLRFFNVFGPGQDPVSPYSGVISRFIGQAERNEPFMIFGDGEQTRDFVYIDDVVRVLTFCTRADFDSNMVINVCTGREVSVNALASVIKRIYGLSTPSIHLPARPNEVRRSCGNPARLKQVFSGFDATALNEGLAAFVRRDPFEAAGNSTRFYGATTTRHVRRGPDPFSEVTDHQGGGT